MIEALALFMFLGTPALESNFEGTVFDTNGAVVKLEVQTKSFVLLGRIYSGYSCVWEGVEGVNAEWNGFSGGPCVCSSISARLDRQIVIKCGDVTVERNGVAIFRMPAPHYDWTWEK